MGSSEKVNSSSSSHGMPEPEGSICCASDHHLDQEECSLQSDFRSRSAKSKEDLVFRPSARAKALLSLAHDLGKRLLPAFDSPTGIPYSRVNLAHGITPDETPDTCSAAAGSLVLEFTLLSRLTGDVRFETVSKRAFHEIWKRRSLLGLIGSSIEVKNGKWLLPTSTIGAGVDSFFEYAFKAGVMLDDEEFMEVWEDAYRAVTNHVRSADGYVVSDECLVSGFARVRIGLIYNRAIIVTASGREHEIWDGCGDAGRLAFGILAGLTSLSRGC